MTRALYSTAAPHSSLVPSLTQAQQSISCINQNLVSKLGLLAVL